LDDINQEHNPHIDWNLLWALFSKGDLVEIEQADHKYGTAVKLNQWAYTGMAGRESDP
jgi:hypothetical protein